MIVSLADMNARFEGRLEEAGYQVRHWQLECVEQPGCVAENPYFAVVFQPFEAWGELQSALNSAEFEITNRMRRGSSKVWDTYLLAACREDLSTRQQFDELVRIQYDTRRIRKMVMPGVGEALCRMDDLLRPFLALRDVQTAAQRRDPLAALTEKLVLKGHDRRLIERAVVLFREGRGLDILW
ncbi:MAG: hypothetical protein ACYC1C_10080 [Chloroflexota bacterium]